MSLYQFLIAVRMEGGQQGWMFLKLLDEVEMCYKLINAYISSFLTTFNN